MALQIGDKVKFLNAKGGGKITQLIDKNTVMVLSDIDDFEIPVLIRELIPLGVINEVDSHDFSSSLGEKRREGKEGVFMVFAEEGGEINCFLVNGKKTTLFVGVFEEKKEEITGIFSGMLRPHSTQKIASYFLKELEHILTWKVQGFYFEKSLKLLVPPLDCVVKLPFKRLMNEASKEFVEEIGQEGIVIALEKQSKSAPIKAADFFTTTPQTPSTSKNKKAPKDLSSLLEVDLHIHELLENTQGMTNGEMLEYQLDTFRNVLTENKQNKGRKIVFIHGVGNGVLKQRIRHELQKYPRYSVQDASFQAYGWGATMVIIR